MDYDCYINHHSIQLRSDRVPWTFSPCVNEFLPEGRRELVRVSATDFSQWVFTYRIMSHEKIYNSRNSDKFGAGNY